MDEDQLQWLEAKLHSGDCKQCSLVRELIELARNQQED